MSRIRQILPTALTVALAGDAHAFADEGECLDYETTATEAWIGGQLAAPAVAASSRGFLVRWVGSDGPHTALLDPAGAVLGGRASTPALENVALGGGDDAFLAVGTDAARGVLVAVPLDGDGWVPTLPFDLGPVSFDPTYPQIAWDGAAFLVIWPTVYDETRASIHYARISPAGVVESQRVVATVRDYVPVIASSAGTTWLVWTRNGAIVGVRLGPDGGWLDGEPIELAAGDSARAIAGRDGRFLVITGSGRALPLDAAGPTGPVGALVEEAWMVVPDATGFTVVARRQNGELRILRLSPAGALLAGPSEPFSPTEVALASDGRLPLLVTLDETDTTTARSDLVRATTLPEDGANVTTVVADAREEREVYTGQSCAHQDCRVAPGAAAGGRSLAALVALTLAALVLLRRRCA